MITFGKFSSLKKITKYFHVAKELQDQRDELAQGNKADTSILQKFLEYLVSSGETEFTEEIRHILSEKDDRKRFERVHFLFHMIKEHFGYPEPESRFIMSSRDRITVNPVKSELILILENLRSAFNVGSIIRSCECFGVNKVYLSGITPGVDNQKVLKTAKGCEKSAEVLRCADITETVQTLKDLGYIVAGAETGSGSIDLKDYTMPSKSVIIFGNEEIGLTSETVDLCDYIISIKMTGKKNSMNVAAAAAVLMYEYSRNHSLTEPGSP